MTHPEFTPGPWRWFGNSQGNSIYLATTHSGRKHVMRFERWGMRGAQPSFQEDHRMVPAKHLVRFSVGDGSARGVEAAKKDEGVYRYDIRSIDHPDAHLIAAAPQLYEALKALQLQALQSELNHPGHAWGKEALQLTAAAIKTAEGES